MQFLFVLVLCSIIYGAISFTASRQSRVRNVAASLVPRRHRSLLSMHSAGGECTCPTNIDVLGGKYQQLPDLFTACAEQIPTQPMLVDNIHGNSISLNYGQFGDLCTTGASGLQSLGLGKGDCVSVFAENSYKWLVMDQSVMKAGGHNAVRGIAAPVHELNYIYSNSQSTGLIVENEAMLDKLMSDSQWTHTPSFIVVLWSDAKDSSSLRGVALEEKYFPETAVPVPKRTSGIDNNMKQTKSSESESNKGQGSRGSSPRIVYYDELVLNSHKQDFIAQVSRDSSDTATILYTSGTTAQPKGVVLRHSNILHQVNYNTFSQTCSSHWDPKIGDTVLSILPCWHIYERTAEYYCLARGTQLIYSNLGNFKNDLKKWKPHYLFAVPRLFETICKGVKTQFRKEKPVKRKLIAAFTAVSMLFKRCMRIASQKVISPKPINPLTRAAALLVAMLTFPLFKVADLLAWNKVRANLGGRLKVLTSGGSLLPLPIELFFDMIGMNVIVGYGLTESSPIILNRFVEHNVLGTVGKTFSATEYKIIKEDTVTGSTGMGVPVPRGQTGVLFARGPAITPGYNNNEAATASNFDNQGYFNTGDLARENLCTGDVMITGRSKDTIVLSNGENVTPQPIEDSLTAHDLIDQAMLVGQDQPYITAVLVVNSGALIEAGLIDMETGVRWEKAVGATPMTTGPVDMHVLTTEGAALNDDKTVKEALLAVCAQAHAASGNERSWERVDSIIVRLVPFCVPIGELTQTLKVKRNAVAEGMKEQIEAVYGK